jgi:ABC-2 type transport system ATP-binding protein
LNLQIEVGEVFGLLGPNGAGKTTTMRMLAGLIAPSVGRASVCGYDVATKATAVRERVGILTESPGLYENLSAEKNLEFFAKLYGLDRKYALHQIERYLKMLGLWERRKDASGTFSKGMKQKLSMARALLHEPPVLIFDEPTSALDPEGAKQVRDFVQELKNEGRTVIYCTHNLAEAQSLCDRVAIIKRALIRVGTPRELQQALYGRKVEIRITNAERTVYGADGVELGGEMSMNDLAVMATTVTGVGDVAVVGERLLVSMLDPEAVTPHVVRELVLRGADVSRVAEVEYPLETAYLELISRYDTDELANALDSAAMLQEVAV